MSKSTPRTYRVGERSYRIRASTCAYERWLREWRDLEANAQRSGDWTRANAARAAFLNTYGIAEPGFHLPPGHPLPKDMCFGPGGRLETLPIEEKRPPGTCWDDE